MTKIKAQMIIEILGRPPETITEALHLVSKKLSNEKGVKILEETIHEPVQAKDSKNLFTNFADFMIEVEDLSTLLGLIFVYSPSNIDIIEPEKLVVRNSDMSLLTNSIARMMHEYDSVARRMMYERDMTLKKLKEVAPHLFKTKNSQESEKPNVKKVQKKKKR